MTQNDIIRSDLKLKPHYTLFHEDGEKDNNDSLILM